MISEATIHEAARAAFEADHADSAVMPVPTDEDWTTYTRRVRAALKVFELGREVDETLLTVEPSEAQVWAAGHAYLEALKAPVGQIMSVGFEEMRAALRAAFAATGQSMHWCESEEDCIC